MMTDTPADGALRIAESIRSAVERLRLPHADAPEGYVTVSIGVATREGQNYETAKDLIAACDRALYQVKEDGRNDALADAVAAV